MTKKANPSLYSLIGLIVAVSALLIYNFTGAVWNSPTATAPGGNTEAPVNVGDQTQVKTGNFGANILAATSSVWSPEYCDENGKNCLKAGVPLAGEVGSLAWVSILPSAPALPNSSGTGGNLYSYPYGSQIDGVHLCPVGFLMGTRDINNQAVFTESDSNNCSVRLTGTYQVLSFAAGKSNAVSGPFQGGGDKVQLSIALVQKINVGDRVFSLDSKEAIRDLLASKLIGNVPTAVYNGATERAQLCSLLEAGTQPQSWTNGFPDLIDKIGKSDGSGGWTISNSTASEDILYSIVCAY